MKSIVRRNLDPGQKFKKFIQHFLREKKRIFEGSFNLNNLTISFKMLKFSLWINFRTWTASTTMAKSIIWSFPILHSTISKFKLLVFQLNVSSTRHDYIYHASWSSFYHKNVIDTVGCIVTRQESPQ